MTKPVSALRQRMIDDMKIRNMSPNTQYIYARAVANFSSFHQQPPDKLSIEDVRRSRGLWLVKDAAETSSLCDMWKMRRFRLFATLHTYARPLSHAARSEGTHHSAVWASRCARHAQRRASPQCLRRDPRLVHVRAFVSGPRTTAQVGKAVVGIEQFVEDFPLYGRERLVPRLRRLHFELLELPCDPSARRATRRCLGVPLLPPCCCASVANQR